MTVQQPDDPGAPERTCIHVRNRATGRALEWCSSAVMILAWGIPFAWPGNTMALSPVYQPMLDKFPEMAWAAIFIGVGLVRIVALTINGRMPTGSPLIRIGGSFLGVMLWALIFSGFLDVFLRLGAMTTGLGLSAIFLAADGFLMSRAAMDYIRAKARARNRGRLILHRV